MDINKLAPWNWFKKEQEQEGKSLPVPHRSAPAYGHSPLLQVHHEIDRLFDDVFRNFGFPAGGSGRWGTSMAQAEWLKPTLDVGAADKEYFITVELPGVEEKDVQLELSGDTLRIKGEKRQEKEEKDKDYYRVERSYGSFQRVLTLPDDADRDGIKAVFKNGIMKINVPRKAAPKTEVKQIAIKSE